MAADAAPSIVTLLAPTDLEGTQLMPHGVPGQGYGPFEGRGPDIPGSGVKRRTQLCRYIQPIRVYGLENVTVI